MANKPGTRHYTKRVVTYWLSLVIGYIFPFLYFFIATGITKEASKVVLPTVLAAFFLVAKLTTDIPKWVRTWQPSFWKGLLIALPKLLTFIILISFGVVLKWMLMKQIEASFNTYFETVLVLFGGQSVGSVVGAFHLKYKQLDLIDKGYVLGVVNE